ncbi:ABC transporter ATP-binding protein [Rhizobium sp. KVB221]|uniref:Spermidine/putrescine import ATP-binding protein PotA n=1 Tax=Rhizobium setariae TaxID=2801340 RepID=A0A937CLZ1_9HYPH|nr:ABC transporter ATP-binding protein [Rhizobium setariae]MBL0372186.1 ABC transporter ATP-binding protein [Rhizobium setariae]
MADLSAIDIRDVFKHFGHGEARFAAVDGANLSIRQNEFFTLLGPSGCGKTTLLRLIAGFEFPSEGELVLHGENIAAMPPFKRPINTVFQNYALFPHLTVAENIGFGLKMLGKGKDVIAARVSEMLKLVRMEHLAKRATSQLSGGQQQRVALARALAPSPKVLLLDEPLSALDYKLRKEMQIELKRLQAETGITFVFVTHDQEEALTMSDRIAVMSSGKILQVGAPRDIYDRPADRFVADFIGETNFLKGKITALNEGKAQVAMTCGATLSAPAPEASRAGDEVTVMLRPEHARLVGADDPNAILTGSLANIIYFGTDTYFNVSLSDGSLFTVRQQNRPGEEGGRSEGDIVGISFPSDAIRVLRG